MKTESFARMFSPRWARLRLSALLLLVPALLLQAASSVHAATAAGSVIRNQASATYRDASGVERFTTSNILETVVQQAAGVQLTQDQSKLIDSGGEVTFPHVLTNTGNGDDTFSLSASDSAVGDQFDFSSMAMFADIDQNGVADDAVALTLSPTLAAGESFHFVVVATVPGTAGATDSGRIDIVASSTFDALQSQSNTDTATVSNAALIDVVKSLSTLGGDSPDGPFTVTLSYRNDSDSSASDVTLVDALPAGMSYIAGSARWSVTGSLVLSDADALDSQGTAPDTIRYCAYQAGCTGLAEAWQDSDSSSANQVTAILNEIGPGESGTLTFDVDIDAGLASSELINTAEFEFDDGTGTTARVYSNSVAFRVAQQVAIVANGSVANAADGTAEPVVQNSAYQGASVAFDNIIWNTGNGSDIIDIIIDSAGSTFPTGTSFQLFQADGLTPLVDSSGNGIPDTGPLKAGSSYRVVLRAGLPPTVHGDNAGAGFDVSKRARSTTDPGVTNDVTDHLDQILPSSVDLTNDAPAGEPGALGEGAGPEATAQLNHSVAPGASTRFTLHAANIGSSDDSYDLAVSTDPSFATVTLPPDWTVSFLAEDGSVISSTGNIAASASARMLADVRVPAGQAPGDVSLYFRIRSPATGALDVLHDAVSVKDAAALMLEPNGNGQLEPGGAIVYTHQLKNVGNATINAIELSSVDTLAAEGWSSSIHEDSNDNGEFDAADTLIDSIAALSANTTRVFFVKVTAPGTASPGSRNTTRLQASWNSGADSIAVNDVTLVDAGDIGIVKEQAPDLGCDGVLEGPHTRQPFAVEPGNNCVQYRLTATNAGVEPVYNAIIQDATPAFTLYHSSAVCSAAACTITEPAAGGTGLITGEVATVAPGESVQLIFTVLIE
ncbi:hypothetical protein ACUNV4_13930 [Granulosicoccus sp. 3-233]|uniref:hypothetical protein n=1 Tax=Granulosicoccus sp. 3-233 TaxID=3417969 RepID=UPI003D32E90B